MDEVTTPVTNTDSNPTPTPTPPNYDSILVSVKKMLGIDSTYTHFDPDLIMHINTVLTVLGQLGVGPSTGFSIEDDTDEWDDFVSDMSKLQFVKTYVYLKVKLLFDPPQSSAAIEALNRSINELEWRINVQVDPGDNS